MAKKKKKAPLRPVFEEWQAYMYLKTADCIGLFLSSLPIYIEKFKPRPEKADTNRKTSSKRQPGESDNYYYIAYRFLGEPNGEQAHTMSMFAGSCRFLWNEYLEYYNDGKKILTAGQMKKIKSLEWLDEVDSNALNNVQLNFEKAKNEYEKGEKGRPRFKKKHLHIDSYKTNKASNSENIWLRGDKLKLPKIKEPIRVIAHRKVIEGGRLKSVTVTKEADGRWYFSIMFEYDKNPEDECLFSERIDEFIRTGNADCINHVGLDMSLPNLFVSSDGTRPEYTLAGIPIKFTKQYRKLEKKIAKEQRKLSRMEKDSKNYSRQCIRIAGLHARAKHARQDFLTQLAVRLARKYDVISIENLNMSAMKKALKFGKSVSDNGWGFFVEVLERKCFEYGHMLIRMDKWFASSKTCCECGYVHKELKLSDRTYVCPKCGNAMDRDEQAGINIDREGLRLLYETWNKGKTFDIKKVA